MTIFDTAKVGDHVPAEAFPDADGPDVCDYRNPAEGYNCVRLKHHTGLHMDTYDDLPGLPRGMREVAWIEESR